MRTIIISILIIIALIVSIIIKVQKLQLFCDTCVIQVTKKYNGNKFVGEQLGASKRIVVGALTYKNGDTILIYDIKTKYKISLVEKLMRYDKFDEINLNSDDLNHVFLLNSMNIIIPKSLKITYLQSNCSENTTYTCSQYWGWYEKLNDETLNEYLPYFGVAYVSDCEEFSKYIGKFGKDLIPQEIGTFYYNSGGIYKGLVHMVQKTARVHTLQKMEIFMKVLGRTTNSLKVHQLILIEKKKQSHGRQMLIFVSVMIWVLNNRLMETIMRENYLITSIMEKVFQITEMGQIIQVIFQMDNVMVKDFWNS
ncbi:Hypothetical_protein [Hexamita inflata]|uniref:Hypothetical_protein n=1 Tax=Hexamita inflata TaxID=28002 RepID=A0AA86PRQ7_9EUKA|nr:Hypothetical protein HINF_LOCUS31181 [Hexamita inflata]